MTAWWRWRGQRWHFVVFHLFFDICFDLTISTDKKHIGHLKGCFCYINRNKKNIFLQKETPWCCFICLKFLALCKVIFFFFNTFLLSALNQFYLSWKWKCYSSTYVSWILENVTKVELNWSIYWILMWKTFWGFNWGEYSILLLHSHTVGQNNQKSRCKYWATCLSICSHHSLVHLLRTACFTRALPCAHLFARSLSSLSSLWEC